MLADYSNPKALINPQLGKVIVFDSDFIPSVDLCIDIGEKYGIKFFFNSGFRKFDQVVSGAIVEPATMSNHFIGHAFDCNYIIGENFYNSKSIRYGMPEPLIYMIVEIKSHGLRWGGDFSKWDGVHFDDGLNLVNPELYKQKLNEYQTLFV